MKKTRKLPEPFDRNTLLQAERGWVETGHGAVSAALVYPNRYGVGMASLGFQVVRRGLQSVAGVERAFSLDDPAASFESARPLGDFDLLAFSVAFELDYLNVLRTLEAAAVGLPASRRRPDEPLILCGGAALDVNPAPIRPFVDIIARFAGEQSLDELTALLAEHGDDKYGLFEAALYSRYLEVTPGARRAMGLEGDAPLWGSDMEDRIMEADHAAIEKNVQWDWREALQRPETRTQTSSGPPASDIVSPHTELGERVLVEIASGCPHRCAFCWMGHCRGRYRPWPIESILQAVDHATERTSCQSVGLISSAVGSHPHIDRLCEALLERGLSVSFSSLRAEDITPGILQALKRSGQRGLTLAPEAGSETLRFAMHKKLSNQRFLAVIEQAQEAGLDDLKLYYMLGLPGETEADVEAIAELTDRARRIMLEYGRPRGRLGTLSVNLGVYVRKPGTPLAESEHPDFKTTRKRLQRLTRQLQALPNIRVAVSSPDLARVQERLALGGPDAAALLVEALHSERGDWRQTARRLRRG